MKNDEDGRVARTSEVRTISTPDIDARLAVCSADELLVLRAGFLMLLDGIEKGRTYGRAPGGIGDARDFHAEACDEMRDGLLYLAMERVRRQRVHFEFSMSPDGERFKP